MSEDPIQNFDVVDIVAESNDGSVDLVIIASSFLNESEHHQEILRQKVQAYINEICSEEWQEKYGEGNSNILIKSVEMPHQEIINLIGALKKYLEDFNIGLSLELA
jgi:Family of unknown function (DUF6572)